MELTPNGCDTHQMGRRAARTESKQLAYQAPLGQPFFPLPVSGTVPPHIVVFNLSRPFIKGHGVEEPRHRAMRFEGTATQ